jgi:hypothetical protein
MAYPFRPIRKRKLRKLPRAREDSDQCIEVSNHSIELESPAADPHRNKTSPLPALSAKIAAEKISSQL